MLASFLMIGACVCAIMLANSSMAHIYFSILEQPLLILSQGTSTTVITPSFLVNEFLMVFFFLFVMLEIKRGFLQTHYHSWKQVTLPFCAALGGILVPALLYYLCNLHVETKVGWAIPTTTDIAFSLGILNSLRKPVASQLKLFLGTLAIFDDLFAIIIITFLYTRHITMHWLIFSLVGLLTLIWLNIKKIQPLWPYCLCASLLWWFILNSGVHATIAGVLVGCAMPVKKDKKSSFPSPAVRLEKKLKPWVDYFILPSFAFVNAGCQFKNFSAQYLWHPVFLGIFLGLVLGKPLGILCSTHLALKANFAQWPDSAINWYGMVGVACLGGIGFTMSLLMAVLAFPVGTSLDLARQSILCASLCSALTGYLVLQWTSRN